MSREAGKGREERTRQIRQKSPHATGDLFVEEKAELIRQAILRRRHLAARYHGRIITLYPHALGWRGGKRFVLGLLARQSRRREDPTLVWEWILLGDLRELLRKEGPWRTSVRPRTVFLDLVEVEAP